MSMIGELVKNLRDISNEYSEYTVYDVLIEAADTIEALSAKLAAANAETTQDAEDCYRHCEDCESFLPLKDGLRGGCRGNCKHRLDRGVRRGRSKACKLFSLANMERYDGDGWIAIEDRLPEACKTVLAFIKPRDMSLVYLAIDGMWRFAHNDEFVVNIILAWQPLPPDYNPKE